MRLKLLISFAYPYDYSKEIIVAFTVEGQVSRDDERYLYLTWFGNAIGLTNFILLVVCSKRQTKIFF